MLTAMIVFIQANLWPIVTLGLNGQHNSTTLWGMIITMWNRTPQVVAVLAAATLFFFPLMKMRCSAGCCWFARRGRRAPGFVPLMVTLHRLGPWTMSEVFVLGALVAIVKAHTYFDVAAGSGHLRLCGADPADHHLRRRRPAAAVGRDAGARRVSALPRAADLGLIGCQVCGLVCRNVPGDPALDGDGVADEMACPRCGCALLTAQAEQLSAYLGAADRRLPACTSRPTCCRSCARPA